MKNLLSVSQLMRDGCDITFSHTGAAYITTPSQGQIRLRLDDGLLYLDYLVPQNKNVSPLRPLPTAVFEAASAMQGREYFLDLCAGSCTSLVYHLRRNPHAQCLAVDWLSEHRSPEAKCDHASLTHVLQTFHDSHFDPRRTLITVENPLGKFKDLDPV